MVTIRGVILADDDSGVVERVVLRSDDKQTLDNIDFWLDCRFNGQRIFKTSDGDWEMEISAYDMNKILVTYSSR